VQEAEDKKSANAVVIGRSNIVGKSVSLLLQRRDSTVTMCHSRSRNLPELCRRAGLITPHRRGVGPMTITMLLRNTLDAWCQRMGAA